MVSAQPANSSARDDKQPALSVPEKEQKIREIVVLPAPDAIDASRKRVGGTANATDDALARTAQFVADKTKECRQLVQNSSAVSFAANYLQSRVISTELGTELAKLYEILEVKRADEFDGKLERLLAEGDGRTAGAVQHLRETFRRWEDFLAELDQELERVAGPEMHSELGKGGTEIQLVQRQGRSAHNDSLLSYLQSSSYPLMFLEVVASFAVQECYEHVKRMFDTLPEFHKLGCDILLLTRRPSSGGGDGFLKLIGMPFRMLLNESESMRQILMHQQSANSMAGLRALHIYIEFLCNDQPLEIATQPAVTDGRGMDGEATAQREKQQSGCVLLDRQGRILYSYLCTDSSDWPDVEVLLEQVRLSQSRQLPMARNGKQQQGTDDEQQPGEDRPSSRRDRLHGTETTLKQQQQQNEQPKRGAMNGKTTSPTMEMAGAGGTSDAIGQVAVHKPWKCCVLM